MHRNLLRLLWRLTKIVLAIAVVVLVLAVAVRAYFMWPVADLKLILPEVRFNQPIQIVEIPGAPGRWIVAEKDGLIKTFAEDDASSVAPWLDLRERVQITGWEDGLLSVAFSPDLESHPYLYAFYSAAEPLRSVISRFRLIDGNRSPDLSSEQVILSIPKVNPNHNGGHLLFGPDGYLYISVGEGNVGTNGQDRTTLLGAILRIDVRHEDGGRLYAIPADNPFTGVGGGIRGEIWAYGFRNPWRLSFDRKTGTLYAGDVGGNRSEEINRIEKGGNYGWKHMEGLECTALLPRCNPMAYLPPIGAFPRFILRTITGGVVYRGSDLPDLEGRFIIGDYFRGLYSMPADPPEPVTLPKTVSFRPWSTHPQIQGAGIRIASVSENSRGEIYITDLNGAIYRLVPLSFPGDVSCYPIPFGRC